MVFKLILKMRLSQLILNFKELILFKCKDIALEKRVKLEINILDTCFGLHNLLELLECLLKVEKVAPFLELTINHEH